MNLKIKFKRGDSDDIADAVSNNELTEAEPFYFTDTKTVGVGISSNEYIKLASVSTTGTLTLTVAGWAANSQQITVTGVNGTSTNLIVIESATMGDRWAAAKVYATSQGANSITFTCQTTPTENIEFKVTIIK
jgi:hypothetical protein